MSSANFPSILAAEIHYNDGAQQVVRMATESFHDPVGFFDGRISGEVDYDVGISVLFWGQSNGVSGVGSVELINSDRALDSWYGYEFRDQKIILKTGRPGENFSAFTQVADGVIENIEFVGESSIKLLITDKTSLLEKPMQRAQFADTVQVEQVRGLPLPIVRGTVYQVPCIQYDAVNLDFRICDQTPTISQLTDRGDPFAVSDFTDNADGTFRLGSGLGSNSLITFDGSVNGGTSTAGDMLFSFCVSRAGLTLTDVPVSTINGLTTATGSATVGFYSRREQSTLSGLRQLMDSFGGYLYFDELGVMQAGILQAPGAENLTFNVDEILYPGTEISRRPDDAPGLTDTISGRRNWLPIDADRAAGSLTQTEQAVVSADFRFTKSSVNAVDDFYSHAVGSAAFPSLLDDETQIQDQADRWGSLYSVRRDFVEMSVILDQETIQALKPGETVIRLVYARLGIDKNYVLIRRRGQFIRRRVDLTLWG